MIQQTVSRFSAEMKHLTLLATMILLLSPMGKLVILVFRFLIKLTVFLTNSDQGRVSSINVTDRNPYSRVSSIDGRII